MISGNFLHFDTYRACIQKWKSIKILIYYRFSIRHTNIEFERVVFILPDKIGFRDVQNPIK